MCILLAKDHSLDFLQHSVSIIVSAVSIICKYQCTTKWSKLYISCLKVKYRKPQILFKMLMQSELW